MLAFEDPNLWVALEAASDADLDALDFGVVAMAAGGEVVAYNRWESELSGLDPSRVIGRRFFDEVAPCTNTPLVADRYATEPLDALVDYVFAVRIALTPVTLRLIRQPEARRWYLLVRRA